MYAESRPYETTLSRRLSEFVSKRYETILISDNMIGYCLIKKEVDRVFCFYQRVERDTAYCQVGSLLTAVLAKELGTPCYLYPTDYTMPAGDNNHPLCFAGDEIVPRGVKSFVSQIEKIPLSYVLEKW